MSQEHARKASTPTIDLPPTLGTPQRPPSPVLSSPLPSAQSPLSVASGSSSSPSSELVVPPAPARKRRAAAVAAESAIRQQLHDSGERRSGQSRDETTAVQQLLCDEDESTIDSCLSTVSSTLSAASHPPTSAYLTPQPRKRRSRRRRNRVEADAVAAAANSDSASASANKEQSGVVMPTYLPSAIQSPADDIEPIQSLRRSARHLSKAASFTLSTVAPAVLPNRRAISLPVLRSTHAIFHDAAIICSVLSDLPLSSLLPLRSVSTSFLRASYTPTAWHHQHINVSDEAALTRLRSSTALLALLPSLTINLVSCPGLAIDLMLRAVLVRLPSLRCLRLLNCTKLTRVGVNAVLYCGALTELTIQNCGSLQAQCLTSLLDYAPNLVGNFHHLSTLPDVPRLAADDAELDSAKTDVLAAYRSTAYISALSNACFDYTDYFPDRIDTTRPLYDHRRLIRLDLTKYRNFRDQSLLCLSTEHWQSFTALRHVNLRGCREVSEGAMRQLANVPLLSLDLSFCVLVDDEAIERLAEPYKPLHRSLTSLTLTADQLLTDGACQFLASFSSLSHLGLSQLPLLTDHGLIELQRGPACLSLCSIDVSWCERLVGDWLVGVGEGWTRQENERRMGADFLDYFDRSIGHIDVEHDDEEAGSEVALECDSDGDGIELADARREAAVIARRRAAQREKRKQIRDRRSAHSGQRPSDQTAAAVADGDDGEMWNALRYVDVRYCHGIDVGSKVILGKLRPDIQLKWR